MQGACHHYVDYTMYAHATAQTPAEATDELTDSLYWLSKIDEAEARVRNVTYRGAWPKAKPATFGFEPAAKP